MTVRPMNEHGETPSATTEPHPAAAHSRFPADTNPYRPPERVEFSSDESGSRVWSRVKRNFVACVAITIAWVLVTTPLVLWGIPITGEYVLLLLLACGAASTWANVSLGPKIGWSQGGLPVVFLAVTTFMTVYAAVALVVASSLPL